jgi:hypothetical protein
MHVVQQAEMKDKEKKKQAGGAKELTWPSALVLVFLFLFCFLRAHETSTTENPWPELDGVWTEPEKQKDFAGELNTVRNYKTRD